jgi:hypothetical protein
MGFYFQSRPNNADPDAQDMKSGSGLTYNPSLNPSAPSVDPNAATFTASLNPTPAPPTFPMKDPNAGAQQPPYWVGVDGTPMGNPEDYFSGHSTVTGAKPPGFGGPDGGRPVQGNQGAIVEPLRPPQAIDWRGDQLPSFTPANGSFGGPDDGRPIHNDPSELVVSHGPAVQGAVAPNVSEGIFNNAQQEKEAKWAARDERLREKLKKEGKLTGQMVPVNAHGQGIEYVDAAEADYRLKTQAEREAKRHQQQIDGMKDAAHFGGSPAPHVASSAPQATTGSSSTDFNWHPQTSPTGGKQLTGGFGGPKDGRRAPGSASGGTPIPVRTGQPPVLTPATDTKGFYSPGGAPTPPQPASPAPAIHHTGQSLTWTPAPPSHGGVKPGFHNEGRHAPPAPAAAPAPQFPMKDPNGAMHTMAVSAPAPQFPMKDPSGAVHQVTSVAAAPAAPEPIKVNFPSASSYTVSQSTPQFNPNDPNMIKTGGWGSAAASAPPPDPVNIAWNFDMDIDTDPVGGHKKKKKKKSHRGGGAGGSG